jgi:hypothetical protein
MSAPVDSACLWLEVLKGFGPILIAIPTLVLAYLGYQLAQSQKKIASDKLRLDLFDKRTAVYKKVQETVLFVVQNANLSALQYSTYVVNIQESRWLFGDDVFQYLDGEYKASLRELLTLSMRAGSQLSVDESHRETALLNSIPMNFDSRIIPLFASYMRVTHK